MPDWAFLTNHALVLGYIAHHPRITARDLARSIGITERTIRKIIADLLAAGYVTKKREGRGNRYRVNSDLSLRHPTNRDGPVGDLLEALGWTGGNRVRKRPAARLKDAAPPWAGRIGATDGCQSAEGPAPFVARDVRDRDPASPASPE